MRRLACIVLIVVSGCGYHLSGDESSLPEDVQSLSVGTLVNRSREFGLAKTLAFAFEREIHERGHFRMEEEPGAGDAVLSGIIRDVSVRPVSFDANDMALQYAIVLTLDLTLTRQRDGKILWSVSDLREADEYSANARVVVTSSSQFQQGTLGAADVRSPQFNNIELAETERRTALARLLRHAARDVYNQMVEEF
ncbi:MAG: LPS assembly lipoprotein LptE [Candidatus Binatia bacterium]